MLFGRTSRRRRRKSLSILSLFKMFSGTEKRLSNGHGVRKIMKDKGLVVYRPKTSTKESPAIDLSNMNGFIKNQKIHFIKGEKD